MQDPKLKRLLGIVAVLVVLVVGTRLVLTRPPAVEQVAMPTPFPKLDPPVKGNGYTIVRIIGSGENSIYHVQVDPKATREQMASYAESIKSSYQTTKVASILYYAGDVDEPKNVVGSYVNGRVALNGEGLAPTGVK